MDDYIRNGENESCIFNPLFFFFFEYLCMRERKAGLKEAQKYQFVEMFVFMECLCTKNP